MRRFLAAVLLAILMLAALSMVVFLLALFAGYIPIEEAS